MIVNNNGIIKRYCDHCYPLEAIITVDKKDKCLICAAIEGLI